jgi:response regulator RpfG family c-di-GMP phosphodiesterase
MLSGQANDLIVQELSDEKHLDQFISKPWDEEKLYQVVRPILESVA